MFIDQILSRIFRNSKRLIFLSDAMCKIRNNGSHQLFPDSTVTGQMIGGQEAVKESVCALLNTGMLRSMERALGSQQ